MHIERMHDEVAYRRHLNDYNGRRGKRKYYPCVSVGAEIEGATGIGNQRDYSRANDFHSLVLRELAVRLGELNNLSNTNPACHNRVGHCAENYAASNALEMNDPQERIQDEQVLSRIAFTEALQPRTWKQIDWCANCHTMFD